MKNINLKLKNFSRRVTIARIMMKSGGVKFALARIKNDPYWAG